MKDRVCRNCGDVSSRYLQRGMCPKCYRFWLRHGVMRSQDLLARLPPGSNRRSCKNCHEGRAVGRKLCHNCLNYLLRTGKPRPRHLWLEKCVNCGKPRTGPRSLCKGRCKNCYRWWTKYGEDRQIEPIRWCDCGHAATHHDVRLPVQNGASGKITEVAMDLCQDCYELEFEP